MILKIIFSLLLFTHAASDYENLVEKFKSSGVTPLKQKDLHPDTRNKEMVQLGRLLFFDKVLSGNKNISCATCHFPSLGTGDALPVPIGTGGSGLGLERKLSAGHFIPRNAPPIFNMGFFKSFHTTMWDGRISVQFEGDKVVLKTPEPKINGAAPEEKSIKDQITSVAAAQALFPVTSHHEMRGEKGENEIADAENNITVWALLTERLLKIERYRELFEKAFPEAALESFNFGHVARAIAAFEMKVFRADKSDFDDFMRGDKNALSRSQFKGAQVFVGKGNCTSCHSGGHFTDFKSHSAAMPQLGPGKQSLTESKFGEDKGLALISGKESDLYKFKTPTLRNVQLTGPWSHSGAYNNLKDFLKHHTNAKEGMKSFLKSPENYVLTKSFEDFASWVDLDSKRNQKRLTSLAPDLRNIKLSQNEIEHLFKFLKSLSDKRFYNRHTTPKSVPSGLTVKD